MPKFVALEETFQALHNAGVIEDDPSYVRRVVIDLEVGSVGKVYVEKFADDEQLAVAFSVGITVIEGGDGA